MSLLKLDARREALDNRTENTKNEIERSAADQRKATRKEWLDKLKIVGGLGFAGFIFGTWFCVFGANPPIRSDGAIIFQSLIVSALMLILSGIVAFIFYFIFRKMENSFHRYVLYYNCCYGYRNASGS